MGIKIRKTNDLHYNIMILYLLTLIWQRKTSAKLVQSECNQCLSLGIIHIPASRKLYEHHCLVSAHTVCCWCWPGLAGIGAHGVHRSLLVPHHTLDLPARESGWANCSCTITLCQSEQYTPPTLHLLITVQISTHFTNPIMHSWNDAQLLTRTGFDSH